MMCSLCGKKMKHEYTCYCDGYVKRIRLCKKCLKKVLKDGAKISKSGLKMLLTHAVVVQESTITKSLKIGGKVDDVYLRMPIAVLRILFHKDDYTDTRIIKELYEREIDYLHKKLKKAVKEENYKAANELKIKMERLKKLLGRK